MTEQQQIVISSLTLGTDKPNRKPRFFTIDTIRVEIVLHLIFSGKPTYDLPPKPLQIYTNQVYLTFRKLRTTLYIS